MVATAAGNKVSKHLQAACRVASWGWGWNSTSWYEPLYSISFLHLQLIHIFALSPQVTVYIALVLAKHIDTGVESWFSRLWYGVRVVQTTLHALFQSTITGAVVQGLVLEALLYLLLMRVIWPSHTDLSGSGPHKLNALTLIIHWAGTPRWRQCHAARQ